MSIKVLTMSAALAVGIIAVAAVPMDSSSKAEAQRRGGMSRMDMTYVAKAGASDMYEIESSRLALQRSRRADVREMAQQLITDHTRTTQLVMEAARADRIMAPPPRLEPRQRTMIRQLERSGARDFDRMYLMQQVTAHQEALALHRTRARGGGGPNLTRVAASAVPIIQGHLQHARQMARMR